LWDEKFVGFFLQKYQNYSILIETINKWQYKMRIDEIKARIYPTLIKFGEEGISFRFNCQEVT